MIFTPEHVPNSLRAKIAVVGSGPAGMSMALDLAKTGCDVALIESGLLKHDARAAALAQAASMPPGHAKLETLGARRFGGLSSSWGGRCVSFDPIDFEKPSDRDQHGWPTSLEDMTARSKDAAAFLGIGAPEFQLGASDCLADLSISLERWCAQPQLVRTHLAACKATKALNIYLGLTCVGGAIDARGHLSSLTAQRPDGGTTTIQADHFVLATGGVETSRLLHWMFRKNPNVPAPRWLGRGYMGHLKGQLADLQLPREHSRLWDYRIEGDACFTRRRLSLAPKVLLKNGLRNIAFHLDNPPLNDPAHGSAELSAAALALSLPALGDWLSPTPMRRVLLGGRSDTSVVRGHLSNVAENLLGAAAFGVRSWRGRRQQPVRPGYLAGHLKGRYALAFNAEQSSRWDNRIELSDDVDATGLPRVRIVHSFVQADLESVLRAHHHLQAALNRSDTPIRMVQRSAPEEAFDIIRRNSGDGYHQIGGARMALSPHEGVVDTDARVFGLANLYVAGSAVFPTSGQANPTYMIVCQSLRLAAHLRRL